METQSLSLLSQWEQSVDLFFFNLVMPNFCFQLWATENWALDTWTFLMMCFQGQQWLWGAASSVWIHALCSGPIQSFLQTIQTAEDHREIPWWTALTKLIANCFFLIALTPWPVFVWAELQQGAAELPREIFACDPAHSSSSELSYRCRKCR